MSDQSTQLKEHWKFYLLNNFGVPMASNTSNGESVEKSNDICDFYARTRCIETGEN